jgi:hypothetical protein
MPGRLFAGCGSRKPSSRPSQGPILLPGAWNVYLAGACCLPHWGPNLGPYENCCKIFKSKALKIYVSHRLAGMGKDATLAIMAKTMRETDMFDQ